MSNRHDLHAASLPAILAVVVALAALLPAPVAATGPETAAATPGTPARIAYNGSRKSSAIALTFDDGADVDATRAIFAILQAEGVPATFFPYAYKVRAEPALWREIAAAGYPIGHHSLSHADLTEVTGPRLRYEIRQARRIIEQVTDRPMLRVLRPPYGARDERLKAVAGELGYPTLMLWDVESRDTARHVSVSRVYELATRGRNGSVVLMHAGPRITPRVLRAVIANYRARGFTFVTIPELLGPTRAPWPGGPDAPVGADRAGSASTAGAAPAPSAPPPVPDRPFPRLEPIRS